MSVSRRSGPGRTLTTESIAAAAAGLEASIREHRRRLHRRPELALAEHETAAYIESVLGRLGITHRRVVGTGVVGVLAGRADGGCVALRADMDALPVEEAPGREGYRSEVPGLSHACGHDGHVAVLLGLAELVAGMDELPGSVALYFQPAEEGPGGAAPMVEAGVLDDPAPQAVLALHVSSRHPSGVVALRDGPMTGSTDTLRITIEGVGGHAAHPHTAVDPVPIAAQLILAAQLVVTREVAPTKPAVITFGTVHGGTKPNVIASQVELGATLRAVESETRELLLERVPALARSIAAAHRASASVDVVRGFPAGSNDAALVSIVAASARAVLGEHRVLFESEPSLGAEDFFAFGDTGLPVCMFRLGVANAARGITAPHHSPDFDLDESALPNGVAVFAETIRRLLAPEA